ncbi:meiotically up-regulated gene 113-domain-containing protein, partial [Tirmania nivea]
MPFVAGTPESLEASLQRRDSKDFGSTCRGINQNGTPCRTKISAKVSVLKTTIDGKEAYFCWRHKEQASELAQKKGKAWDGPARRGSMDVLVEKVVAMAVTDEVKPSGAVTAVKVGNVKTTAGYPFPPKLLNKVRFDTTPPGPPLPHMVPSPYPGGPPPPPPPSALSPPRKPASHLPGYMSRRKLATLIAQSKTGVIPPHLSAPTQKRLHETLTKPFSASDTPGYIYIFALLPSSPNRPPTMPALSTIDPNDPASQVAPRVLLKIGRTVNVASRLNQHANQCNYEPTLIRYYPHPDSKSVAKGGAVVHKVPNVNRIERLIHLELRDNPKVFPDELRHKCAVCGKIHKEWFSVEATEEGVKWVDGVVSRWIAWGE